MRSAAYKFSGEHITGASNKICDALSRLCTTVKHNVDIPLPTPRLLPISKRVTTSAKQQEILDPLVVELGAADGLEVQGHI